MDLRIAIPLALALSGLVAVLRLPRQQVLTAAVVAAVAMAVLVPSFSTSAPVAVSAVVGAGAILAVALVRCRTSIRPQALPWPTVAFLLWTGIAGSFGAPPKMLLLYGATSVLLLLLLLACVNAPSAGLRSALAGLFGLVLLLETVAGGLEEAGLPALWPMSSGVDLITHRVNTIIPALPGRALGTTSQPIPYGALIAFSVLAFLLLKKQRRRWAVAAVLVSAAGLAFSGSRSAVLALLVATGLWVSLRSMRTRYRGRGIVLTAIALLVICGAAAAWQVHAGASTTSSFEHRAGVLGSSGDLLGRRPLVVIFGSGFESIPELFASGIVHGTPGIHVFDNEYVRTLAGLGILGIVLLAVAAVHAFFRGAITERALLVLLLVGFASFDALSWRLMGCVFVLVIGLSYNRSRGGDDLTDRHGRPRTNGARARHRAPERTAA